MAIKDDVKCLILTMGVDLCVISTGVCIVSDTFLGMIWCGKYDD